MWVRSSGSAAVDAMDRIKITGNVIPPSWYGEITRENGRPYLLAIILLADIVYWYRPVEERDESSGLVIGLRKKFKDDLLQKTYNEYAQLYGESKRTIKAALDRLEELGLIRRIFREVKLKNGTKIPNFMFIEIFPERIEQISHYDIDHSTSGPTVQKLEDNEADVPEIEASESSQTASFADSVGGGTKFCGTPYKKMYTPPQNNVTNPTEECTHIIQNNAGYPTPDVGTNTKNTTQITHREVSPVLSTKDEDNLDEDKWLEQVYSPNPIKVKMEQPRNRRTDRDAYIEFLRNQVQYDRIRQEDTYGDKINIVDGIINIIADIATADPPDGYERVNGRQYPHEVVKGRLLKMDYDTLTHVLERFKENKTEIRNMRSYLLTTLYNAFDEKDIQFQNYFNHTYYGTDWTSQRIREPQHRAAQGHLSFQ